MSDCYRDLRDALDHIPSINAHVHQDRHGQPPAATDPVALLRSALPESFADRELVAGLGKAGSREAWATLVGLWPRVRGTGYGRTAAQRLRRLGVTGELTAGSYEAVAERLAAAAAACDEPAALKAAGVRASLSNVVGHPCFASMDSLQAFLDGRHEIDEGFLPLLGCQPLHDVFAPESVPGVERAAGMTFGTVQEMAEGCRRVVAAAKNRGAVGIKDHRAYSRGIRFQPPNESTRRKLPRR